jgi:hypothetical protein
MCRTIHPLMLPQSEPHLRGLVFSRREPSTAFGAGDRIIVQWLYGWADGHVRGVDLLRVRAGRVAETLAYVEG